jgi:hypothetical protein
MQRSVNYRRINIQLDLEASMEVRAHDGKEQNSARFL